MTEEIKVVDYGRFIYLIPKGTGIVIILDKKEDDVNVEFSSVVQYYGGKVVGATYMENYFIRGLELGEVYDDLEKWWSLFGERLLIGGCKQETDEFFYPKWKTSDFSKEELRLIGNWSRGHRPVTRDLLECDDLMLIKEVLRKDQDKVYRLKHSLSWYFRQMREGNLSKKAFMTLKDEIILRDMEFIKHEKLAKEYDDLEIQIPYVEFYELGEYFIRAPNNFMEIASEGKYMGNCIGTYLGKIVRGSTRVYFMRMKDEPDTPFMDIEVDEFDDLCQALMRFNEKPPVDLLELIQEWRLEKGYDVDASFNEYGQDADFIDELRPDFQEAYVEYLE